MVGALPSSPLQRKIRRNETKKRDERKERPLSRASNFGYGSLTDKGGFLKTFRQTQRPSVGIENY
jgi:hypothetical protein